MSVADDTTVLSSWKDIARYLGKGVRTVQRWEQHLGLPVRRPVGASQKSAVLLNREDVDAWLATRFAARTVQIGLPDRPRPISGSARVELRERLQTAQELRNTHLILTQQIADSIRLLNEGCKTLSAQSAQSPWGFTPYTPPPLLVKAGTTTVSDGLA